MGVKRVCALPPLYPPLVPRPAREPGRVPNPMSRPRRSRVDCLQNYKLVEQFVVLIAEYSNLVAQLECGVCRLTSPGMADRIEGHGAFVRLQSLPGRLRGVAGALELLELRLVDSCGMELGAHPRVVPLLAAVKTTAGAPGLCR